MWEDLEDGDRIPVIQGPQGGWHLLGSVRMMGLEAGDHTDLQNAKNPTTQFEVWYEGTNYTPDSSYTQGVRPGPSDAAPFSHEMVGRFAILDIRSDDELDEVDVEFRVTVTDVKGRSASDSRNLRAYAYELNQ